MSHTLLTAILTRLGLLLLQATARLPGNMQIRMGALLGRVAYRLSKKWRSTTERNISAAFPDLNRDGQQQLISNHFRSLGIGLTEMGTAWWGDRERLRDRVTIQGLEYLQAALKQGNGVILLSAHFTTLEIGGRLLSLFHPLHAMYRKQDNPLFNRAMVEGRNGYLESIVEKKDLRGMLRLLKNNQTIWYAMDQNSSDNSAAFTDFFGVPCSTTTATSKLAQISGATVIPFTTARIEPENHYQLTIHPPFSPFPGEDATSDTQQIMDHFEQEIRKNPEQYLWIHRRFKNQPEGYPPFYGGEL
ncbi:MAG: lipid A biosynthesis lauroyl acyltransferase [Gammaproteobacteria bacterium]|jgi:Kdo2-lipid IVA lauroyltransferase/acyltransferase|nr:lipid A biosynthesis lauroyl acyltransferase [Gammaproteobacteria bacterium]